jgi:hypothetical protein
MPVQENTIMIEDAELLFTNFSGRESRYNAEGARNFNIRLPEELAAQLEEDGWNVRALGGREEGDIASKILKVTVNFKGRPPKIVMITSGGKRRTDLDESTVELLDGVEIVKADVIIRPYHWTAKGDSGISAYLKTMFVTIYEDELVRKYDEEMAGDA